MTPLEAINRAVFILSQRSVQEGHDDAREVGEALVAVECIATALVAGNAAPVPVPVPEPREDHGVTKTEFVALCHAAANYLNEYDAPEANATLKKIGYYDGTWSGWPKERKPPKPGSWAAVHGYTVGDIIADGKYVLMDDDGCCIPIATHEKYGGARVVATHLGFTKKAPP